MLSKLVLVIFTLILQTARFVQCVPSEADWEELKEAVGGRLFKVEPVARSCFSSFEGHTVQLDEAKCATAKQQYLNSTFKTSSYAGFVHSQNEACASNVTDQCLLTDDVLSKASTGFVRGPCNRGSISERYIAIANTGDVQAALRFARRTNTTLSVKATGHDYAARSSRKGSLALWTRQLNAMEFHPAFTPLGSSAQPVEAVTVGSGANLGEVYKFCDSHNVTFVGGSSGTVAAAGGFTLLGGHGVLTPLYGMGADRVLELSVVTPDGVLRTANKAMNKDLFWALCGAGSTAFGVVHSATFKVEPAMPVTLSLMKFNATDTNTGPFLDILMNNTAVWAEEGWGGPMSLSMLALINPLMDTNRGNASMKAAADYVTAQGGTIILEHLPSFYSFYTKYMAPTSSTGTGFANFASFRVLPKRLHQSKEGRDAIARTLQAIKASGLEPTIFQTTPINFPYVQGSNSVHQAWRDSFWLAGTSASWPSNDASLEDRIKVAAKLQQVSAHLTALAPEGSMYPNEADPWIKNWAIEFWGERNYAKLLQIKQKYDPDNLLTCFKCVGFEDRLLETDSAFKCIGAFQGALVESNNQLYDTWGQFPLFGNHSVAQSRGS